MPRPRIYAKIRITAIEKAIAEYTRDAEPEAARALREFAERNGIPLNEARIYAEANTALLPFERKRKRVSTP